MWWRYIWTALVGGSLFHPPLLVETSADPVDTNTMAAIPAGSFVMGANTNMGWESNSGETPQHTVYVSGFYMDKYEVSLATWSNVYGWAVTHGYIFDIVGFGKATNHPVQTVNWYDVVKWCNARSEKEGLTPVYYTNAAQSLVYRAGVLDIDPNWVNESADGYRLPTEAEWEKAARGGVANHRFPWSDADSIQHARANYYSSTSYSNYDTSATRYYHPSYVTNGDPYTSPVGVFAPNGYGLYDMAGNVQEWCWDLYGSSYYSSSPGTDPRGVTTGVSRVLRGGSWTDVAGSVRCAYRDSRDPNIGDFVGGFRCVRGGNAQIDSDGDGMMDLDELMSGTDPFDPNAVLGFVQPSSLEGPGGGLAVTWQSVTGRFYNLGSSSNLTLWQFNDLATNIVGQAGVTTFNDTTATNGKPRFYRVRVQP